MQTITTIGLDIAKSVFQVHGVDAAGQVVIRRQLRRRYVMARRRGALPIYGRDRGHARPLGQRAESRQDTQCCMGKFILRAGP